MGVGILRPKRLVLLNVLRIGEIPKRSNGADCKSVGIRLRRFESCSPHVGCVLECECDGVKGHTHPHTNPNAHPTCGSSSVGRAAAFQAAGRGFEPRLPLFLLKAFMPM